MPRLNRVAALVVLMLLSVLAALSAVGYAWAAETVVTQVAVPQASGPVSQTAIDIKPILDAVVVIISSFLGLYGLRILIAGYNWLAVRLKIGEVHLSDAEQAKADAAWRILIGYGTTKAADVTAQLAVSGGLVLDAKSSFVKHAFDYGLERFPELLRKYGVITANGQPDLEVLARILNSRLGMAAVSQAMAPQTIASGTAATPVAATSLAP